MEWLSSLGFFGSALRFIILMLEVILVFNLMILVHEWGHFLAAKWRGLKIEKFYIWFGKPIWKKNINGVEYGLGSLPFGGFVALPQMAPMDAIEGKVEDRDALPPITALDKIIVAFAGPLFSFLLACVFALLVGWVGMPKRFNPVTTLGYIKPDSAGEKAGLKPGDKVLTIDGTPITSWDGPIDSLRERIAFSQGQTIEFVVEREGESKPIKLTSGFSVEKGGLLQRSGLRTVGVGPKFEFDVGEVKPNSPAAKVGIQKGDSITHLNGQLVMTPAAIDSFFDGKPEAVAKLKIKRGDQTLDVDLTVAKPDAPAGYDTPLHGMLYGSPADAESKQLTYPNWIASIKQASTMMARTLSGLFTAGDNVSLEHLSGPLKIGSIYYNLFKENDGWRMVLWFSVILNVNLALMNLIPFPVLDGGHIVMGIAEMIRRRPIVQMKWLEILQTACALMLFGFMIYVTWFDAWDLAGNGKKSKSEPKWEEIQFNG
jgi:regulator of sigma E protease